VTFDYFAYGSNMLSERVTHATRCPGAILIGVARVANFRLSFSKRSIDGSGKATLVEAPESDEHVYGVLFRIPREQRDALDNAEGKGRGYERHDRFAVRRPGVGGESFVTVYIAELGARDDSLLPYDWYRDLALAGALQNHLPDAYIAMLRNVRAVPDPKLERESRVAALALLQQAGFRHRMLL